MQVTNDISTVDWAQGGQWKDFEADNEYPSIIDIKISDPNFLANSTYGILVNATSFVEQDYASFALVYASSNTLVTLTEDVTFTDKTGEEEYRHYVFPIQSNLADFKISITSLTGDQDLYVSLTPNNTKPTKENFDFKSSTTGSDIITLSWENTLKIFCPGLAESYTHGASYNCKAYIGVMAYSPGIYSLVIH